MIVAKQKRIWAKNGQCTFLLRRIPRQTWEKFKKICADEGIFPIDGVLRMLKDYVEMREK